MHVVMAAGGTAGHIEPALNTADTLREIRPECTITFLGSERGLETSLVPARGYPLVTLPSVPVPRGLDPRLAKVPGSLMASVRAARRVLREGDVDVVVGFGGYASAPAYLAARRERVPLLVHEANARPGWANRLGARLTRNVAAVRAGDLPHARAMGMPLRRSIRELDRATSAEGSRIELGVRSPTLLVFGGSQGARRLNELVAACLDAWLAEGITVIHVYGSSNTPPVARPGYLPLAFTDRMDLLYAAADLVICRAGAMTCAEVAAVGLPAIYIPLPIGNGEQELNALPTVRAGGGLLMRDQDVTPARLIDQVGELMRDEPRRRDMGDRARAQGVRDADRTMAEWIIRIADEGRTP